MFQIHLSNVICSGSEHSILECNNYGWGVTGSCAHKDDAGVRCIKTGVFLETIISAKEYSLCNC